MRIPITLELFYIVVERTQKKPLLLRITKGGEPFTSHTNIQKRGRPNLSKTFPRTSVLVEEAADEGDDDYNFTPTQVVCGGLGH